MPNETLGQPVTGRTASGGAYYDPAGTGPTPMTGVGTLPHGSNPGTGQPSPPVSDTEASDLRAQIAREQWADYQKRFQPLEDILRGYANDPAAFITKNRQNAVGDVDASFAQAPGQIQRQMGAYGLQNIPPEMQQNINQKLGLQKSLSEVQASNVSDRLSKDQLLAIESGGLLTGNQALFSPNNQQVIGRA